MRKRDYGVWIAVTCAGSLGAGGVLAFGDRPPSIPATVPVAADGPVPNDNPNTQDWLPKKAIYGKLGPTAYTELRLPDRDPKDHDGKIRRAQFTTICPRLWGKIKLTIDPKDDSLRKLLKAQLHQGTHEFQRLTEIQYSGNWKPDLRPQYSSLLADMQVAITELWANEPKELIPWLEELVVVTKEFERFVLIRVEAGTDPPHAVHTTVRHRLALEVALWKAKHKK